MFISQELQKVNFNDDRLNKRALIIGNHFMDNPHKSIPQAFGDWANTKACYRFLNNQKVTRNKLIEPHYSQTIKRCNSADKVLLIQDTTTLSFGTHEGKKGFGPVNTKSEPGKGMFVHSTLAVEKSTREPLGIIHQDVIVRDGFYPKRGNRSDKLHRETESRKWMEGVDASFNSLANKKDTILIADREADFYDFMKRIINFGYSFVIRQVHNRKTINGYISTAIESAEYKGMHEVTIHRNGNRKKRIADIKISACENVEVYPPLALKRKGDLLPISIITAIEVNKSAKEPLLHWKLMTTLPVKSLTDCIEVIEYYQARWVIEEFHKGLKTGCSIEERQLSQRQSIENLLGVFSIISVILLHMRHCAKSTNGKSIKDTMMTDIQKTIIMNKFDLKSEHVDYQTLLICIARLGGFLARKGDGPPGWITLMRGYVKLIELEQGYQLAMKLMGKR